MGTTVVNRKTLIGEIVNQYPETGGGAARNRYALPRLSSFPGGES